jgi:hypoxanthine phosphoribosyltransferase
LAAVVTSPRESSGTTSLASHPLHDHQRNPRISHTLTPIHSSFLKRPGTSNIPIQAIGLSLYEKLGTDSEVEAPGTKVTRTQWLDLSSLEMANLIGKNVLIVDEVDDTRTTLEYAVRELEKDVEAAVQKLGRQGEKTNFSIFVLHNKDKAKKGSLPQEILHGRYIAARTVGDVWINYPWEATYVHPSHVSKESLLTWM